MIDNRHVEGTLIVIWAQLGDSNRPLWQFKLDAKSSAGIFRDSITVVYATNPHIKIPGSKAGNETDVG